MQQRQGFTLVEMLVAMALTLFIMVIITTAFTTGLETFRGLKGIGDMQAETRNASQRIRADLKQDHFDGKKRLSDRFFLTMGKPLEGFFSIGQNNQGTLEGKDRNNIDSFRSVDHWLHFSVKMRGNRPSDFYTAVVPVGSPFIKGLPGYQPANFHDAPDARFQQPGSYHSQWAEVAYYLVKTGSTKDPLDPTETRGTALYSLYRVQRVAVSDNRLINNIVNQAKLSQYQELSCQPDAGGKLYFNTPMDMAKGKRAFSYTGNRDMGKSLLLTNVVSFQVQVLRSGDNKFTDISANFPAVFDTATATNLQITAIRVTLRVWDEATEQSNQVTLVQEL